MSQLILSRRRLLGVGAAGASSLMLSGCDQFDFLTNRNDPTRNFLERANEELERASLQKRSFIPHIVRSVEEEKL